MQTIFGEVGQTKCERVRQSTIIDLTERPFTLQIEKSPRRENIGNERNPNVATFGDTEVVTSSALLKNLINKFIVYFTFIQITNDFHPF